NGVDYWQQARKTPAEPPENDGWDIITRMIASGFAIFRGLANGLPHVAADSAGRFESPRGANTGPRQTVSASFLRSSFLRSFSSSSFLRSRIDLGVTSTSSSSSI